MRRQLYTGIHDVDQAVTSIQHIDAGQQRQRIPVDTQMSNRKSVPTSIGPKLKIGTEPRPYSLSERQLRATAFAARIHSLKYYIGLIGVKSIN